MSDLGDTEAAGLLMLFSNQTATEENAQNINRINAITKSPGPAAAALAGNNSGNKAAVAAAALAAAAATPMPLAHRRTSSATENIDRVSPEIVKQEAKLKDKLTISPTKSKINDKSKKSSIIPLKELDKELSSIKKEKLKGPPEYAVHPDSGIIGCICGLDHDDGFTIQCDNCYRWQHAACMGIENEDEAPDNYLCYLCDPSLNIDSDEARKLQQARLQPKRRKSPYASERSKENTKSNGNVQFKKRKTEDEQLGIENFKTLYYPIDTYIFKSEPAKSLFNTLPELLKSEKNIIRQDKNHLRRSLIDQSQLNVKQGVDNPKAKFTGISKIGLFTNENIKSGSIISLFSGELDMKENYINEKCNQFWLFGCPKPSVFFHPTLPLVIDERGMGNHTRFIRKSCSPNCEIKTVVNKHEVQFILVSTRDIKNNHELTLSWNWDDSHPILELEEDGLEFNDLSDEKQLKLLNSIHNVTDFSDCGCFNNSSDCMVGKIKKIWNQVMKNKRKGQYGYNPTPDQNHISIEDKLHDRNNELLQKSGRLAKPKDDKSEKFEKDDQLSNNEETGEVMVKGAGMEMTMTIEGTDSTANTLKFQQAKNPRLEILKSEILPVRYELLKSTPLIQSPPLAEDEEKLFTPVGLTTAIVAQMTPEPQEEGKPKKKKFSLADYKKKKG
ncbi:histone-binding protein [Martiniozyma asiatica (nom. inval.)]|nr:histone-binding protein [Martiniozyma asiatica]